MSDTAQQEPPQKLVMPTTKNPVRLAQCMAGAAQGGAELFFERLVQGLAFYPTLQQRAFLRPDPQQRLTMLRNVHVACEEHRFPGPAQPWATWRYRRALKSFQPDVVLTWMSRASSATPRGDYTLVNRLGHYYDLKYYQHADYWIGISKGICDYLVQNGMPAERVIHLPNFADETTPRRHTRNAYGTPPGSPLLFSAGRLHPNKGFDVLLQALVELPEATLWLAGDGPEAKSLKKLSEDLGVASRVVFLGWRTDVTALMAIADVFVCPSRHEGLGSIVLESWAHGCAVAATASQGPSELIEHGVTGMLSPVDDPTALAGIITDLLSNPQARATIVANAAAEYKEKYSRDVVLQQYHDVFCELAAKRRG